MSWEMTRLGAIAARAAAATLVLGSICIVGMTACAASGDDQIVAKVNGEPITAADIEQRLRFERLATRREPSRREVTEALIEDKRKLYAARQSGIDITDSDVDHAYATMAKRMKLTPEQLTGALAHAGVEAQTLKQRIRADIAFMKVTRAAVPIRPGERDPVVPRRNRDEGPSWRE